MKKLIKISSVFLCAFGLVFTAEAQQEAGRETTADIVRFSLYQPYGSTRIQSLGGAQTALGGDMSNAAGNPAGLGFYNRSEFSFTPAISVIGAKSNFLGEATKDLHGNLNFNNIGFVFSKAKDAIVPGKWRGGSFALTYTTTNNFNNRFKYSGTNVNSSLANSFAERATGSNVYYEDLLDEQIDGEYLNYESLALATYLIDVDGNAEDNNYFTFINGEEVRQTETVTTSGSGRQINLAYGGNYNDRIYFGASVGIPSFRYTEEKVYKETVLTDNDQVDDIESFTLNQNITSRGTGINLNLGLLFRPFDILRLGVSVQTPTYYYVRTTDEADLYVDFNESFIYDTTYLGDQNAVLAPYENEYSFTTPWKVSGGLALFFNKNGFITADVDYIPYNTIQANSVNSDLSVTQVNRDIRSNNTAAYNIRVGAEYRFSIFRIRGGYANYGSALSRPDGFDNNPDPTHFVSAGLGLRYENMALDFGIVNTFNRKFGYTPYYLDDYSEPTASVKTSRTKGIFTLSFFF